MTSTTAVATDAVRVTVEYGYGTQGWVFVALIVVALVLGGILLALRPRG